METISQPSKELAMRELPSTMKKEVKNMDRNLPATPSLISFPRDQGDIADAGGEAWWFSSRLSGAGRTFYFHQCTVVVREPEPTAVPWGGLREVGTDYHVQESIVVPKGEMTLGHDALEVKSPLAHVKGDLDKFTIDATFEGSRVSLVAEPDRPVIQNGGSGSYAFHDGITFQYSLPGIPTRGTVEIGGETIGVEGETWYDRQWWTDLLPDKAMKWFGLVLDNGLSLSIFDTSPFGSAWATISYPDGSCTVAVMPEWGGNGLKLPRKADGVALDVPTQWSLSIPLVNAELTATNEFLFQNSNIYNASTEVVGTYDGKPVTGRGWFDIAISANQ